MSDGLMSRHVAARDPAMLLIAVAAAYANALGGPFQFDDYFVIVDAAPVKSLAAWWADLGHGLRPLLKLSYWLDGRLGWGTAGYHVSNLLIHAANVLLVRRLALHAARAWLPDAAMHRHAALLTALIFALHPANTEAVTYISGRSVSFMSLLFLSALLSWRRGATLLSLLLFVLALAVKEPAASLPPTLLLIAVFGLSNAGASRRSAWWRHAPFWLLPIAAALWLLPRSHYRGFLLGSLGARGIADNLLSQIDAVFYLLKLACLLRAPNIDPALFEVHELGSALSLKLLAMLAMLIAALSLHRTRPWLAFGALWFVLQLLPTNSVLPRNDLVNDRQLYLSGIGLWMALSFEIAARKPPPRAWSLALPALALVLSTLTHLRNRDYASEIALWRTTTRASPDKPRPWNNLGYAYQIAGCRDAALAAYDRALALDPDDMHAANNRAALRSLPAADSRTGCLRQAR